MSETVVAGEARDCDPFYRVARDTVWDQVFEMRDACFKAINDALRERGLKALVTRTENGRYPPRITVEGWRPAESGAGRETDPRLRGYLVLTFEALPYHERPVVVTVHAEVAQKTITVAKRPDLDARDCVGWALYVLGAGGRPASYRPVRDSLVNLLRAPVPFMHPLHHNPVQRAFRNSLPLSLPAIVGVAGAAILVVGIVNYQDAYWDAEIVRSLWTMAAGALAMLGAVLLARRQRVAISVTARPVIPPRELLMLDSWHAVVPDLGKATFDLQRKIAMKLSNREAAGIAAEVERYGLRTPNGFDERDRIVVSKGQGVAHVHVYRFGDDLFVGWDSYLNWARWQETPAISARREGGVRTEYRGLQAGLYVPNQFDLIDLNGLTDLVHRIVVDLVKASMAEHKIDQEIDFTIIRGDREGVLDQKKFDQLNKAQPSDRADKPARRWKVG